MPRREELVEMATMAGMGMVDPCFNGTLNTGRTFCVRMFRHNQRYNKYDISGLVLLTPQPCFTGLT